jgi:hypothetical protein
MRAMALGGSASRLGRDVTPEPNVAAFLRVASARQALEGRPAAAGRSRQDRYRDLLVIMAVIRVQYAQLAGRPTIDDGQSPLPDRPHAVDGAYRVAEWAQPWGFHAMCVFRNSLNAYGQRCDRLGRWLSARARAGAAAEARSYLAGLAERLEIRQDLIVALSAPQPTRSLLESASGASASERPKVVGFPGPLRATAVGATACLAAGVGAFSFGGLFGEDHDSAIAPQAVTNAPARPLPALVERSHEPQPVRHRDTRQHSQKAAAENDGSTPRGSRSGTGSASAATSSSESTPTTAPAPTIAPAPTTTTAPEPTSAPDPTSSPEPEPAPAPEPEPAPAPEPELDPVSP